jgi:2-C-methyl-D-erythritol 4-phosphate cytidylyltransferase
LQSFSDQAAGQNHPDGNHRQLFQKILTLMEIRKLQYGAVVVAGGTGSRMGGDVPKQFLMLAGKPVLAHTLERFLEFDPGMALVVVMSPAHRDYWAALLKSAQLPPGVMVAKGGNTRFESVKNGLEMMRNVELIGIHDAVRPLVSLQTLERCYESARLNGSGIPVTEVEETIRMVHEDGNSEHLDRTLLRRVQTPQVFDAEQIHQAYNRPYQPSFTDDASVYESCCGQVHLVAGNPENIKITTSTDLMLAALLMEGKKDWQQGNSGNLA